jgi:DNA gyrase subunit B
VSKKSSSAEGLEATYSAKDITVLSGLEPVRVRPAMYIGGVDDAGLHHLIWEILDNSIDEVMNGHATKIEVTLDQDRGGIRIKDNGRGIPTDVHPEHGKSALELILTTLHAGGKFGQSNYQFSGGLHGVGASVVNALSEKLEVTVWRQNCEFFQAFSQGISVGSMQKRENARGRGTSIYFKPDPLIFPETTFNTRVIMERLEAKSYLHRVHIIYNDLSKGEVVELNHGQGIDGYLTRLVASESRHPSYDQVFYTSKDSDPRLEVAMQWVDEEGEWVKSYVNGIPTTQGGTHDMGLKSGVSRAVRNYMETHSLMPKNLKLGADELRDGLRAVLSAYVVNPQFKGQTKDRLNNPEVTNPIASAVANVFEQFLNANPKLAEAVVERIIVAAKNRAAVKEAVDLVARKAATQRLNLPGKLADCSSTKPSDSELFIVEGDSAGGSAKQGRDRKFQAVLPLRGKVLNTEQAQISKIQGNKEILNLLSALGCGVGSKFEIAKTRYHRIIILTDADSDGHHIAGLLLTFFYRFTPGLMRDGYVYLGCPPLYRLRNQKQTLWAWDEKEKEVISKKFRGKCEVTRFKGLGEMSAAQLKETTLDPATRMLYRVRLDDEPLADQAIRDCFGKDPAPRFRFVMERANEAQDVDV